MTNDYTLIKPLSGIYLEDSYVLDVTEDSGTIRFTLEAVLTPDNKKYHPPNPGEQYCYMTGELIFSGITRTDWIRRSFQRYTDATGEIDYGNIDALITYADGYELEGDWGTVRIWSEQLPSFHFV